MTNKEITRREMLKSMGVLCTAALLPCKDTIPSSSNPSSSPSPTTPLNLTATRLSRSTPTVTEEIYLPHITSTPPPTWTGLSFIVIMCDTLRYDYIGFNGNTHTQTPNIDAFAAQSQVFDKAYAGGFPTLLNRAELFTGRYMFPCMGWEDIPAEETVLAQVLNDEGYTTGLVFDTWHLKAHQFSFDRAFGSWHWIRGQENDRYSTIPLHPSLPASPEKLRHGAVVIEQYLRNVSKRQGESDYFVARTMQTAIEWLRDNYNQNKWTLPQKSVPVGNV